MDKITLSTNLVNAVLSYLASRPYSDVSQLISAIQKEAQDSAPKPATLTPQEPE